MTSIAFNPFDPNQAGMLDGQTKHGWNKGVRRNADGAITEIAPWDPSTGKRGPDRTYRPQDYPIGPASRPQRESAAYSPGAAQPKQQSFGTAYNPSGSQPFSAWTPQQSTGGVGTQGGAANDPRWSQNGGQWPSGPGVQPIGGGFGGDVVAPPRDGGPPRSRYGQPMGDALPPPPGAFGGQPAGRPPAQPGQRTPVTRPTPGRAPGEVSPYPAALPPSSRPYYDEVIRQFPGLNQFQAAEMANQVRAQQEREQLDITSPVAPMPAERTPAQIAYGQQQQRQREQSQERQRQKMRQQEARNNAQRMDPNWQQNQASANEARKERVRQQQAAAERDAQAELEAGPRGGVSRQEYYDSRIDAGRTFEEARKDANEAYYHAPLEPDRQPLYWQQINSGMSPAQARSYVKNYFYNLPR